jgi:predicted RNA-binding Zn ribbon-like protein
VSGKQKRISFYFVGNYPCLDFINTQVIENGEQVDLLESFADLVTWCKDAKIMDQAQAQEMIERWSDQRDADRVFRQAIRFRAALRDMAELIAAGKAAPRSTVELINGVLRDRAGHVEVVRTADSYEKRFHPVFSEPIHLLAAIADSAGDLLSEGDLRLVRKCENPACILYFYDNTKNHARRWCSMSACGNRAKAAAHYQRKRAGALTS